jgi:hypothetical protein
MSGNITCIFYVIDLYAEFGATGVTAGLLLDAE